MQENIPLLVAMTERCQELIQACDDGGSQLPASLRPGHLAWMCKEILAHAEEWPATKTSRWIGFLQGGMVANRMIDLAQAKAMFDQAKIRFGGPDQDLLDHLDPDSSFELDIGGRG